MLGVLVAWLLMLGVLVARLHATELQSGVCSWSGFEEFCRASFPAKDLGDLLVVLDLI